MGRKLGGSPPFIGGAASLSDTMLPGSRSTSIPSGMLMHPAVWPQWKWAENLGGSAPLLGEAGSPSSTMWPKSRPTSVPSAILIYPAVGHSKHGPKIGGALPPFWGGGAGSPCNPKSLGPRPISRPWYLNPCSHLAITGMGRKLGLLCHLFGEWELGPHLTHMTRAEAYLHAKFHLDPSNRLAKVHQRYGQDRQTGQRSDSIGRTVLQTPKIWTDFQFGERVALVLRTITVSM